MKHFVAYHNEDKMGYSAESADPFSVVTRKSVESLVGAKVWSVSGVGKPRSYFLNSWFIVEQTGTAARDGFEHVISGTVGEQFKPAHEISSRPWFRGFIKSQSNFSLGLQPIQDQYALELESLVRRELTRGETYSEDDLAGLIGHRLQLPTEAPGIFPRAGRLYIVADVTHSKNFELLSEDDLLLRIGGAWPRRKSEYPEMGQLVQEHEQRGLELAVFYRRHQPGPFTFAGFFRFRRNFGNEAVLDRVIAPSSGGGNKLEQRGPRAEVVAGSDSSGFSPKDESPYLARIRGGLQPRTRSHERLVRLAAEYLVRNGGALASRHPIDLCLQRPASVLFEAKIVDRHPIFSIREAVGQLLEYRYFHGPHNAALAILLDKPPTPDLVDYVENELDMRIFWLIDDTLAGGARSAAALAPVPIRIHASPAR